jgi:hypothetical protein
LFLGDSGDRDAEGEAIWISPDQNSIPISPDGTQVSQEQKEKGDDVEGACDKFADPWGSLDDGAIAQFGEAK